METAPDQYAVIKGGAKVERISDRTWHTLSEADTIVRITKRYRSSVQFRHDGEAYNSGFGTYREISEAEARALHPLLGTTTETEQPRKVLYRVRISRLDERADGGYGEQIIMRGDLDPKHAVDWLWSALTMVTNGHPPAAEQLRRHIITKLGLAARGIEPA